MGGLTDFIPLFYFSKHPPNTLQTPCNTLQTPLKHPSTPFKQPSKSSFFSFKKWSGKKINRDFIKGGRGGGSPFYEVISQKIFFFTNDGFPKIIVALCMFNDNLSAFLCFYVDHGY